MKPDPCAGLQPIMVSRYDVLTDDTAKQIDIFDTYWSKLCKK